MNIIGYYVLKFRPLHLEIIGVIGIILIYILFGILTYFPPYNYVFFDKVENKYGLNIYEF